MEKYCLALLSILLTISSQVRGNAIGGSDIEAQGLVYLGTLQQPARNGKAFKESDYYVGLQGATWNIAEADCNKILKCAGMESCFAAIESVAEKEFLDRLLETFGSGNVYWTGGIYNPTAQEWIWSHGGKVDTTWAPWASSNDQPGSPSLNVQSRLAIQHESRFASTWRGIQDSQPQRYICEVARKAPCECEP